jgi:hypothetical protein
MSTTAATAAATAAIASSNAAQIAARRAECRAMMPGFQHDGATVVEQRQYAGCVYRLHGSGEPFSPGVEMALKAVFLLALVAGGFGAWVGWRDDGPLMALAIGLASAFAVPLIALLLWGIAAGLMWVVGA